MLAKLHTVIEEGQKICIQKRLGEDDVLLITADHGCDPGDESTDHTREYVPMIVYGKRVQPCICPTSETFTKVASSVCGMLGMHFACEASNKPFVEPDEALISDAKRAMILSLSIAFILP